MLNTFCFHANSSTDSAATIHLDNNFSHLLRVLSKEFSLLWRMFCGNPNSIYCPSCQAILIEIERQIKLNLCYYAIFTKRMENLSPAACLFRSPANSTIWGKYDKNAQFWNCSILKWQICCRMGIKWHHFLKLSFFKPNLRVFARNQEIL